MTDYFIFRNSILKYCLILSTIFITLFFVLGENRLAYGFILGAIISTINFYLMSLSNLKLITIQQSSRAILNFISKNLLFRYILIFLTLIIALKYPLISFSGTLIGLFVVQMSIIFKNFI